MHSFYASPTGDDPPNNESPEEQQRRHLRRLANRHRLVVVSWVSHVSALAVPLLIWWRSIQLPRPIAMSGAMFLIGAFLLGAISVYLAHRETGTWRAAAVRAVWAALPVLGLLPICLASLAASKYLREQQVSVGLLGADPGQFR